MSIEMLDKIITKYGVDTIFGFVYDNNSRSIFRDKVFNPDTQIDRDLGCIIIHEIDTFGVGYVVLKPIGDIQTVILSTTPENRRKLTSTVIA